jgi:hypothetical protein
MSGLLRLSGGKRSKGVERESQKSFKEDGKILTIKTASNQYKS